MSGEWLVFRVADQRYALPLAAVERVSRAVAVTALADAPAVVLGIVDWQGELLPVIDLRRRLAGDVGRRLQLDDELILTQSARRRLVLAVDEVAGLAPVAPAVALSALLPGAHPIAGVVAQADGLLLIQDLDRVLALDDAAALDAAWSAQIGEGGR